jgi:serine/threonine protein kinase
MLTLQLKENKTMCGTPNFMAPEVISNSNYSTKSDIYSLGCTVLEMLTGNVPFYEDIPKFNSPIQFLAWRKKENVQLKIPNELSKNAKGFIEACIQL